MVRHYNIDTRKMGTKRKRKTGWRSQHLQTILGERERERLRDPNEGVDYFKNELRPHFVKGVETVLLWTCRDGMEDSGSSESASLTLGWTPSWHIPPTT